MIELSTEMTVRYVDQLGSDLRIVNAARMSLDVEHPEFDPKADRFLIKSLISNGHGTPFEKGRLELIIEVPIFVAREWFKHRFSSFNEVSGRYTDYTPKFYIPSRDDVRIRLGKRMSYEYEPHPDNEVALEFQRRLIEDTEKAYETYQWALNEGIASESARWGIPGNLYTKFMWGTDIRNLTNFLVLRNAPQSLKEIRIAAEKVEALFATSFPVTYELWYEAGRPRLAAID